MSGEALLVQQLSLGGALTQAQIDQLAALLRHLAADGHAPTSVRDGKRAVDVHIADSLAALEVAQLHHARRIVDIGSGAGFPGLPLAVAFPRAAVTLLESQRRKCDFLGSACSAAQLTNAQVVWTRAEEWHEGTGTQDAVVVRAVAAQPVVLEYAAPLLRVGGFVVDWRGRRVPEQERAAAAAGQELGLRLAEIRRVLPYEGAVDRHLHVFEKLTETSPRFPRRPGIARKRPLGSAS